MEQQVILNIDDDASRALKKIANAKSSELVLLVPKGAVIFSDPQNFTFLRKEVAKLGKQVAVLTMDAKGQNYASQNGFQLRSFDSLKKGGPAMDGARRVGQKSWALSKTANPEQTNVQEELLPQQVDLTPEPEPEPEPIPEITYIQHTEKSAEADTPVWVATPKQSAEASTSKTISKGRKRRRWPTVIFIVVLILVILAVFVLPSANLTIYLQTQPVSRDLQIFVDKNAKVVDQNNLVVPGLLLDTDQSLTNQFQTTGQVNNGTKATGQVQLYNFTGKTLKLGAKTTTLIVGDRTYNFVKDVSGIKPTRYLANKDIDPSSLIPEVDVIATQPGDSYNLAAGTRFDLSNSALGSLSSELYAVNANAPIANGTSNLSSVISQNDIQLAQKELSDGLLQSVAQQLLNSKGLSLLDSGSKITIKSITFDHQVGNQSQTFSGTITAHVSALVFDPKVVQSLVEQRISSTLDINHYLDLAQKETIQEDFKSVDFTGGSGLLSVHFESYIAPQIDQAGIQAEIGGKSALELKEYLLSNPDIAGADITFKPFWVKTVPKWSGRVKINTILKLPNTQ